MSTIEIFFSYSHKDETLREELEKQLSLLKWQGLINDWHDRRIGAGQEWANEIDKHLNTAQIILLLISPDFMASEYGYGIEMNRAMERHERGEATVIPVILRPVYWQGAPFGKLQALPANVKPVTSWSNPDEAFFDIAESIRKIVENYPEIEKTQEEDDPKFEVWYPEIYSETEKTQEEDDPKFEVWHPQIYSEPDMDTLYRNGLMSQSQGDLKRAFFSWNQVLVCNPDYAEGRLAAQINKLFNKLTKEYIKEAEKARATGKWKDEIKAWRRILAFRPLQENRKIQSQQNKASTRLTIAQKHNRNAWMYQNAKELIKAGNRKAARNILNELWTLCPYYSDPEKLAFKAHFIIPAPLSRKRQFYLLLFVIVEVVFILLALIGYSIGTI